MEEDDCEQYIKDGRDFDESDRVYTKRFKSDSSQRVMTMQSDCSTISIQEKMGRIDKNLLDLSARVASMEHDIKSRRICDHSDAWHQQCNSFMTKLVIDIKEQFQRPLYTVKAQQYGDAFGSSIITLRFNCDLHLFGLLAKDIIGRHHNDDDGRQDPVSFPPIMTYVHLRTNCRGRASHLRQWTYS